jgi:hypothetical protein
VKCFLLFLIPLGLWADFGMRTKVQLLAKYQDLDFDLQDYVLTSRLEKAFALPQQWSGGLRIDFPYIWLWGRREEIIALDETGIVEDASLPSVHHMTPFSQQGLGDMAVKAFFVSPSWGGAAWGVGSQFIFPTAQKIELGTGKYAAEPSLGVRYAMPTLASGAWFTFFTKYLFSFAGKKERPSFQVFTIDPSFGLLFYKTWALSLESESQFDCDEKKWFVPISISLGALVRERFAFSAKYKRGIITDFPVVQNEGEITASFLF